MFPLVLYPPSFEAVYCYICGRRKVAAARYRMICLVLVLWLGFSEFYVCTGAFVLGLSHISFFFYVHFTTGSLVFRKTKHSACSNTVCSHCKSAMLNVMYCDSFAWYIYFVFYCCILLRIYSKRNNLFFKWNFIFLTRRCMYTIFPHTCCRYMYSFNCSYCIIWWINQTRFSWEMESTS